jgi:hypothetical protein
MDDNRTGEQMEEFDEAGAYEKAGQVLRDTQKMGIQPHHAQQLADRIVDALRSDWAQRRELP